MAEDSFEEQWNTDPEWAKVVTSYESMIHKIAKKYAPDEHTREDCEQVARWRLYCKYPHQCKAYPLYRDGTITEAQFKRELDKYLRTSIRNAILNYLRQNNWYGTRSRTKKDRKSGQVTRIYKPAWFTSLDQLIEMGADVSETGEITWPSVNLIGTWDDGFITGTEDDFSSDTVIEEDDG